MGLDMFAKTTKFKPEKPVDFDLGQLQKPASADLHYWRKHPNLHGWMEKLYFRKGGTDEAFNVHPVQLDSGDLDQLEQDILDGSLPKTDGFFFGASDGRETSDDLRFIKDAREAIAAGLTVYYYAWW